jgi:hypothetical protein
MAPGVKGHLHIGKFSAVQPDADIVTDLAVPDIRGRGLVGDDGDDVQIFAGIGGDEPFQGTPREGIICGKSGLEDVVAADVGNVVAGSKLNNMQ